MAIGHFLFRGDKTACGGRILEGCPDHQFFDKDMACEGHKVTCGKHPGHYRICGGLDSDEIHGKRVAGTLHSRCSCPCKSRFIPSIDDTYEFSTGAAKADTAQSQVVEFPVLPGPIYDPQADNVTDTCKPEDNPLLNGVYIWTETTSAGHVFVSVHENNNIFLYTYGRYGRTDKSTFTGDGILDFFQDEDARKYYRYELYEMGARAFRIDDADPKIIRKFFENLWNGGVTPIQTPNMQDGTKRRGRTIDKYDVTGSNCTTHSVEGLKFAGSKVFDDEATAAGGCAQQQHQFRRCRQRRRTGQYQFFQQHPGSDEQHTGAVTGTRLTGTASQRAGVRSAGRWSALEATHPITGRSTRSADAGKHHTHSPLYGKTVRQHAHMVGPPGDSCNGEK